MAKVLYENVSKVDQLLYVDFEPMLVEPGANIRLDESFGLKLSGNAFRPVKLPARDARMAETDKK